MKYYREGIIYSLLYWKKRTTYNKSINIKEDY